MKQNKNNKRNLRTHCSVLRNQMKASQNKQAQTQPQDYPLNSKSKGYQKEERVCEYLTERRWQIIYRNKKILGVEIDILVQKKKELVLIEVKSISNSNQIKNILKPEQKKRLQKAAESLCDNSEVSIRLFLATVDPKNQIYFFEIN